MDWGKAKDYTIIFLVFLNITLFLCNLWLNKRYVITDEQIRAVKTILDKKNIKTDLCDDMPVEYEPMAQLRFDKYSYDEINIQNIFFGKGKTVKRTSDFDKIILSCEDKTISIIGDTIEYKGFSAGLSDGFNREYVLKVCGEYMDSISEIFDGFNLYSVNSYDNYFIIEYVQEYKGTYVFNNYVKFKIFENGEMYVSLKYFPVKGFYGEKVDICPADEALFIFSGNVKEILNLDEINILKIERGWYFNDFEKDDSIISMPYYRIEIKETEEPFFINAYDRTFENEINEDYIRPVR